ncbi:glycosyltransferase family 4 protein [Vibrio cholerae]|uniref:glycosyltransferase family 4 protein n=1 Tax=Vibrio cholerae TaxID=666 RepID=UPI001EC4752B|nr:glycosyltransferase family 4 protein [Vibrio cholerae]EGR0628374.1 glycosyltransferase [Vibrio cholerae]EHZ7430922.1 glycosyltransferase family 4 protein [Vibrio cholerae]EKF9599140.1 glycosyltransferase family 4 protein [Vibrio cholerae]MDV2343566.1 glycosyltransferase family 4 protein [Vibrio cholerae]MEB5560780.1 glycosyltransferase [Vibrio cholerae]
MKKANVLHFVYNLDKFSGAAYQAKDLVMWLRNNGSKNGHSIYNRSSGCNEKEYFEDGIRVIVSSGNNISHLIRTLLVIPRYDCIHMHGYNFTVLLLSVIFRKKILLKTTLLSVDDFESLVKKKYLGLINKFLISKVSINNPLSSSVSAINKKYISSDKLRLIPNSISIDKKFFCSSMEKENLFLIVGAVTDRKRTLESIKYYIDNYSHLKGAKLEVIGPYSEGIKELSGSYFDACMRLSKESGCNIRFLGKVNKKEVFNRMLKAKALLFFSKFEGFGSVMIEAQSCNCVPIVTRLGGIESEIITNGKNGYIIDDFSDVITIEEIESIIIDESMPKIAHKKYNPDVVFRHYELIHNDLIGN